MMKSKFYIFCLFLVGILCSYYVGLSNGLKYSMSVMQQPTDTVFVETKIEEPKAVQAKQKPTSKKKSQKVVSTKYRISTKEREEDCKLTAYWDTNGYSIGYGHHGKDVSNGQVITIEQAEELFKKDIVWVNTAINSLLSPFPYNFSQDFIDGLGSLIYNCGEGGVRKTEFYARLNRCRFHDNGINQSDYDYTLSAVKKANITCQTHVKRRQREYNLMKNGIVL